MTEWHDISTAPRDGTVIVLSWFEGGKPQEWFTMQWGHIQRNGLIPGVIGMWVTPDGSMTWDESDPEGAPTHWLTMEEFRECRDQLRNG